MDHAAGPSQRPMEPTAEPSRRSRALSDGPSSSSTSRSGVTVRIVEQPAKKAPKFRYESENRVPEPILGASSTEDWKTYPSIELTSKHTGKANIIVSCVTKDYPYRPHPHKLVGHGNKRSDGVIVMKVDLTPGTQVITFSNIGIVCVKKKDIEKSLALRQSSNIDPFRTGFDHRASMKDKDLHAVRLCFQVLPESLKSCVRIASDVISRHNLQITEPSCIFGPAKGGTKVMLVCEKMQPGDVAVTLYTEEVAGGEAAWRVTLPRDGVVFHHNVVAIFRTPPYRDPSTQSPITAYIQLQSRSTGERSNSVRFTYEPNEDTGPHYIEAKRKKPLRKEFIEMLRSIVPQCLPEVWDPSDQPIGIVPQCPPEVLNPSDQPGEIVPPVSMDPYPMWQNPYELVPGENQQWNQNTPSTSHMDYNQELPWPAPVQNQSTTHNIHQSPRQFTMPQSQIMIPQSNLTSPQDQITLPVVGQVNLPQRQVMLPQDHLAPAQGQSPPDQMKSPCFIWDRMLEQPIETDSDASIDTLSSSGEWRVNSGVLTALIENLGSTDELSDRLSQLSHVTNQSTYFTKCRIKSDAE